jgi:hypothetical protein
MADEKQEIISEFRIQAVHHENGISFEPAIFNQGVPMEYIMSMLHAWLRSVESAYDKKFEGYA